MNVAGLGTAHLSLNAFPICQRRSRTSISTSTWDLAFLLVWGWWCGIWLGIASGGGLNYYFSPKTAINVDSYYAYHFGAARGGFGVSTLGI